MKMKTYQDVHAASRKQWIEQQVRASWSEGDHPTRERILYLQTINPRNNGSPRPRYPGEMRVVEIIVERDENGSIRDAASMFKAIRLQSQFIKDNWPTRYSSPETDVWEPDVIRIRPEDEEHYQKLIKANEEFWLGTNSREPLPRYETVFDNNLDAWMNAPPDEIQTNTNATDKESENG